MPFRRDESLAAERGQSVIVWLTRRYRYIAIAASRVARPDRSAFEIEESFANLIQPYFCLCSRLSIRTTAFTFEHR